MSPARHAFIASLAATALLAVSAARAQTAGPEFTAFRAVCGDTGADFTAVRKASEGNGWSGADAAGSAGMPGVTVSDHVTREMKMGKGKLLMSAWEGAHKNGAKVSDCALHADKANFAGLRDAAAGWLTFAPQDATASKAVFKFTTADGGHRPITAADYDAAAKAGGLEILTVTPDASGAMLDLLVIKK